MAHGDGPPAVEARVGTVAALWRYPVKSMMGEELNAAHVTERGLLGDRAYALLDAATGKVVSAKNPTKWGALFGFRARFVEPPEPGKPLPPVRIALPDGAEVAPGADAALAAAVGKPVRLAATAPPAPSLEEYWPDVEGLAHREQVTDEAMASGTFFDSAPVHVLTTGTLDALRRAYPEGRWEARRFRPNVVLATAGGDFPENGWTGRALRLGGVELKVRGPCGRCVMTTLAQGDLPRDAGILRAAAQHNGANVGLYATVSRAGWVRRGDPASLV